MSRRHGAEPAGAWSVVVVLVTASLAIIGSGPAGADEQRRQNRPPTDPSSFVSVVGDADDWGSKGRQQVYRQGRDGLSASGLLDDKLWIDVSPANGDPSFTLTFVAPSGQSLRPGHYGNLEADDRGAYEPGIEHAYAQHFAWDGHNTSCAGRPGSEFTVHDIAEDLSRVWISYRLKCSIGAAAPAELRGQVRFDVPPAAGEDDVVLSADSVDWPVSRANRSHSDQKVFAINTGSEPADLRTPTVSGDGFVLRSTTCGVLQPGADCEMVLGHDPRNRGTRQGRLRIPIPSGPAELPLTGPGYYGHSQLAIRKVEGEMLPRTLDGFADEGVDYASIDATGDRAHLSAIVDGYDLDQTMREMPLDIAAPLGQQLQAGRAYVGTANPGLGQARFDFDGGCRWGEKGPVRFAFQELTWAGDGSLESARLSWVHPCNRYALYGSFAFQAEQPVSRFPMFVRVHVDQGPIYDNQRSAAVSVEVPGNRVGRIDVYAVDPDGTRRLVKSQVVGRYTRISPGTMVKGKTRFIVVARAEREYTAQFRFTRLRSLTWLGKPLSLVGTPITLPPQQRRVPISLVLDPSVRGKCVRIQVQERRGDRWVHRTRKPGPCLRTNAGGRVNTQIYSAPGKRIRVRGIWSGDSYSDGAASWWSVFVFEPKKKRRR